MEQIAAMAELSTTFELDRTWRLLRGDMDASKEPALMSLARVLATSGTRYAVIGGIAAQVHLEEPRTTIDIDVAVADRGDLPRRALAAAGFRHTGAHAHSDNWIGPGDVPVQFTDDSRLHASLGRCHVVRLGPVELRILSVADLLHAKLLAARDKSRRRSKRFQDLADIDALITSRPELAQMLSDADRAMLDALDALAPDSP